MLFDDFYKEVKNNTDYDKNELYNKKIVNVFENDIFNPQLVKEKLKNLSKLSDKELFNLLKNNYQTILSGIFVRKDNSDQDINYSNLFKDSKFLSILIRVLESLDCITHNDRIYCNKIAYDYLTSNENDKHIKKLMFTLSKTVNKDIIPMLLGIGLPNDLACYLALCRFSSTKEMINIKRLNFAIISSPIKIMSEQMIVWIYEKLFDKILPLFEGIMFDVSKENIVNEMEEIYSTISLAILDILNNMPSINISKLLTIYSEDYFSFYTDTGYRFSMKSLSQDYNRILNVVNILDKQNIYIP